MAAFTHHNRTKTINYMYQIETIETIIGHVTLTDVVVTFLTDLITIDFCIIQPLLDLDGCYLTTESIPDICFVQNDHVSGRRRLVAVEIQSTSWACPDGREEPRDGKQKYDNLILTCKRIDFFKIPVDLLGNLLTRCTKMSREIMIVSSNLALPLNNSGAGVMYLRLSAESKYGSDRGGTSQADVDQSHNSIVLVSDRTGVASIWQVINYTRTIHQQNKSKGNKLPVDRSCPPLSHSDYSPKDFHLNKTKNRIIDAHLRSPCPSIVSYAPGQTPHPLTIKCSFPDGQCAIFTEHCYLTVEVQEVYYF